MLLRTLTLILLSGIPLLSFSQAAADSLVPTQYFYENGQVSSEGGLRDGKPDGYWKSYYRSGVLKAEGNRKNFKLDGPWIFYNREGKPSSEINYAAGQKQGPSKVYEDGVLVKIDLFEADEQVGISTFFYPDSTVQKEVPYEGGQKEGLGFEYSKDGRIITLLYFKKGNLIRKQNINRFDQQEQKQGLWMSFHKNGQKSKEGPYLNDLKNGYWKFYKPDGNLIRVEKWVNGELQEGATEVAKVEVRREIDPKTGAVIFKGAYQNGEATGVHREYNTEGEVIAARVYDQGIKLYEGIIDDQGRKQGPWKVFYRDGNLKAEGSYKNDLKVGQWRYYFPNGQIEQQGNYLAGNPDGFWSWFYADGQTLREEEYVNGLEDGMSTEYNDTGAVIAEGSYIDGMKEGNWTYTINDHKETGPYFEGRRNGLWKHYYLSNDQLSFEGAYENGLETGFHVYYWPNGEVKRRGNYSGGNRDGLWEFFDQEGKRIVTIEYEDGEEVRYNGEKIDYGRRYEKAVAEERAQKNLSEGED
jgi:antitoxin component YwqK of YwqJK toxin-antitoxin module